MSLQRPAVVVVTFGLVAALFVARLHAVEFSARPVGGEFLTNGPGVLGEVNGRLLFMGAEAVERVGDAGRLFSYIEPRVFATDGSTVGPIDNAGIDYRHVQWLGATNDYVYFYSLGSELFATDGETLHNVDLPVEFRSGYSSPRQLVDVGSRLVLSAGDWLTYRDPRPNLLAIDGLASRTLGEFSSLRVEPEGQRADVAGTLLIAGDDVLYQTDGENLVELDGADVAWDWPYDAVRLGDDLLFAASGPSGSGLYKSDGTTVSLVAELNPVDDAPLQLWSGGILGHELYFTAHDAAGLHRLYRSDGATATQFGDFNDVRFYGEHGDRIYFVADSPLGRDLFGTDGASVEKLGVLSETPTAQVENFVEVGNRALFIVMSDTGELTQWATDGMSARLLGDGFGTNVMPGLAVGGDLLAVRTIDNQGQLVRTDGETVTTVTTAGPIRWISDPGIELAGSVLFRGSVNDGESSLFVTDGATASIIPMGSGGGQHTNSPFVFDGRVYVFSYGGGRGQLWEIVAVPEPVALAPAVIAAVMMERLRRRTSRRRALG